MHLTENYLLNGGFPEVTVNDIDSKDYLEVLFDALLFKDVVKRHRVKFSTQIGNLAAHLTNNFASLYTTRKLLETLNLKKRQHD